MNEKFKLYFVFCGHKLRKVNLINAIVCQKSSFKGDMRIGHTDSPHKVSQYLLTHCKALKARIEEI